LQERTDGIIRNLVIEGIEGGIGEDNFLRVILEIAGVSFFANKAIHMAGRSKAITA